MTTTRPITHLVLFSGGLDSTVLLAQTIDEAGVDNVAALSVDYGQRHRRELDSAGLITNHYGIPWDVLDLRTVGASLASALTGAADVPHGHYAEDNMRATVVPNRNAIMLMCAVGVAASRGAGVVRTAVHAGDHPIYPDCRPEFIAAAAQAAELGTRGYGDVTIEAPFVNVDKAQIAYRSSVLAAPVGLSWSCYEGGVVHCGRCGTCVERAEAFHLAGVDDPTIYADPTFWRQAVAAAAAK